MMRTNKFIKVAATVLLMATILVGCGTEDITGRYVMTDISETLPQFFPKVYTNAAFSYDECRIEFMSDGSIIMNASKEGEPDYVISQHKYALVDGKMSVASVLGTTAVSDYKKEGKLLTFTDSDGNYVVFEKE